MKSGYKIIAIAGLVLTLLSEPTLATDLKLPSVVNCLSRQGTEVEVQKQLAHTELVLYNWKTTQGDILILINAYRRGELGDEVFDSQMTVDIQRLKELTNLLDETVANLKNLALEKHGSVLHLSEVILSQKDAGLMYLKAVMGSTETTFQSATENYDNTWAEFVQVWNMTYGMYGCTSTNPWVRF